MLLRIICPDCESEDIKRYGTKFDCQECGKDFDMSEADFNEEDE